MERADRRARDEAIDAFLRASHWADAERAPLAGDASFRRYERVRRNDASAVLMDAPPEKEDVRPFVHIARILRGHGLLAPQILAEDAEQGLLLLEDLGDNLFARVLARDISLEQTLYEAAIDVLTALKDRPLPSDVPAYSDEKLLQESALFCEWCVAPALGRDAGEDARATLAECLLPLVRQSREVPEMLVLRDYHAENLIWMPDGQVGLLDFQDAVLGPCTYDLVSLLEDARRDVPRELATRMKDRFFATLSGVARETFDASYAILGAQRNLKIIGIFNRLSKRDGKEHYLNLIPRVAAHLEHDLAHPALAPLKDWLKPWRSVLPS
ncbi:MAG: phosphotransferase [Alphaproteobacteria bacterium]|nr:phosphotransferase [Alphaproteobacteria bacterium]